MPFERPLRGRRRRREIPAHEAHVRVDQMTVEPVRGGVLLARPPPQDRPRIVGGVLGPLPQRLRQPCVRRRALRLLRQHPLEQRRGLGRAPLPQADLPEQRKRLRSDRRARGQRHGQSLRRLQVTLFQRPGRLHERRRTERIVVGRRAQQRREQARQTEPNRSTGRKHARKKHAVLYPARRFFPTPFPSPTSAGGPVCPKRSPTRATARTGSRTDRRRPRPPGPATGRDE